MRYLSFDDRLLMLFGIPGIGILIPLLFMGATFGGEGYWIQSLISTGYCTLFWTTGRYVMMSARKVCPDPNRVTTRLFRVAAIMIPFTILVSVTTCQIPALQKEGHNTVQSILMSLFLITLVMAIYESIYYISKFRQIALEREQLLREKAQSELDSLRSQVNPHFLFNSLNTLAGLISEDQ